MLACLIHLLYSTPLEETGLLDNIYIAVRRDLTPYKRTPYPIYSLGSPLTFILGTGWTGRTRPAVLDVSLMCEDP